MAQLDQFVSLTESNKDYHDLLIQADGITGTSTTFSSGFLSSLIIILLSEIGDKTFFIAALLSLKNNGFLVYIGACIALFGMTALSTTTGFLLPSLLSRAVSSKIAAAMFFYFGVTCLKSAISVYPSDNEEEEDEELKEAKEECDALEQQRLNSKKGKSKKSIFQQFRSSLVFMVASVVFAAEWGDRSQFATIAAASAKNAWGVLLGGCLGHAICSGLAVLGGQVLAQHLSERLVNGFAGAFFLLFAVLSLFIDF